MNTRFFLSLLISGLCLTSSLSAAGLATIRVRKGAAGLEIFHQNLWQSPVNIFGSDPHEGVVKFIAPYTDDKIWNRLPEDGSSLLKGEEYLWPLYVVPAGGNLAAIQKDLNLVYESPADATKKVVKNLTYGIHESLDISGNDAIGSIATVSLKREDNQIKIKSNGTWRTFSSLVGGDPAEGVVKQFYIKGNRAESVRDDDFEMYTEGEEILWVIATKPVTNAIQILPETYEFVYESIENTSQLKSVTLALTLYTFARAFATSHDLLLRSFLSLISRLAFSVACFAASTIACAAFLSASS